MKRLHILSLLMLLVAGPVLAEPIDSLYSPDGRNMIEVSLTSGALSYRVLRDSTELIASSPLGLKTTVVDFSKSLTLKSTACDTINETYSLPTGKFSTYTNHCNQLTVTCRRSTYTIAVVFRAYDDGIAFRYKLSGRSTYTISSDASEVNIPTLQTCWVQKYSTDYSQHYPASTWASIVALTDSKMCAPALVKSSLGADDYCLVTESANNGNFCCSALVAGSESEIGRFTYQMQGTATVSGITNAKPFESPWRTVYIGKLTTMVESQLNENLNPATSFTDTSWIKAGLSSWDWGAMDGSQATDINEIYRLIDLASEMNWPYFTLDDGWDGAGYTLGDVPKYAARKGVKVFIWTNQSRFQNDETQIRSILSNWKSLGFVGTKIDFFPGDSQDTQQKYEKILKVAGQLQMMVNFHGCTHPSGLRRTYPNLITQEAVYGGEMYFFLGNQNPASHNVTMALTRNVIGPMDYTPLEFAKRGGVLRHQTTWSHQVALATVYESGVMTASDSYDNIMYLPARSLLKVLPAAWDDTRCIEAEPDKYVTVLHRSGEDWYVGSISQNARYLSLPLTFLPDSTEYTAQIWYDGTCPSDIAFRTVKVTSTSKLNIKIAATGGCTVRISRDPVTQPTYTTVEAEAGSVTGTHASDAVTTDGKSLCRGGKLVGWIGNGTKLTSTVKVAAAGVYNMTIFYMTPDTRSFDVTVNGADPTTYTVSGTGSAQGDGLAQKTIHVILKAGSNRIVFSNDNGWAPNFDRFLFSKLDKNEQIVYYRVVDTEGNLLASSEGLATTGSKVATIPSSLMVPLTDYVGTPVDVLENQINTYQATARSQIPRTIEEAAGYTWQNLTLRGSNYLSVGTSEPYYTTKSANITTALKNKDTYLWMLVGDPYGTISVYNKSIGFTKSLTPKGTSGGNQVTMQDGSYAWDCTSGANNGFVLYAPGTTMCINEYGGTGGYLGMYGGMTDNGSSLHLIPVDETLDGISSLHAEREQQTATAYTLTGMPVGPEYRGIVIEKGKKTWRK